MQSIPKREITTENKNIREKFELGELKPSNMLSPNN